MAFGVVRRYRTGSTGTKWPPTRAIIQITDMTEELQLLAVNTASDALESCQKPRNIARFIKKAFDEQLYPGWMCVVGQAFGSWKEMYKQQEKLEVRSTKMPRDMERDALETARRALERNSEPRAVANMIKKEFDQRYTPNWHCIVGNHFGSLIPRFYTCVVFNYLSSSSMAREPGPTYVSRGGIKALIKVGVIQRCGGELKAHKLQRRELCAS
ncbi:unnamed protein product [Taenia asiatica]|uniref:Dynein light chain n=1 Tax=Taenia asiatica TaxID=60517 RepID=A0A158R8Z8_TAEAS|nr:unnamed protein product [Taenia asiatica]